MAQQEKIRSKERLLQKAFDNAQIGIWHWNIVDDEFITNEAFAKILGWPPTETESFASKKLLSICHAEDQDLFSQKLQKFSKYEENTFSIRIRLKQQSNGWIWGQLIGEIIEKDSIGNPSAMSGTLTDISELYHSKNNLLYRYRIEKLVSEISSDFVGIQMQDLDQVIDQALQRIGQSLEVDRCYVFQFRNSNIMMDNTHEWCAKGISNEKDNLQNLPSSIFPWWMTKLNKLEHIYIKQVSNLPVEAAVEKEILEGQQINSLLVVPIHYQKNLLGFIGFDSVVEEKEWMESDIYLINTVAHTLANAFNAKLHQEALLQAKEKAEEGDRIKSSFLATVNHELRTPLHHILGFSELLKLNKIPVEEIPGFADKIHTSGKNLLSLIEDILNLSMADESFVKLRKEVFKGNDLFIQQKLLLEEMLIASGKENQIKLKYKPASSFKSNQFIADKNKINQVIVNLLKNALKFTEFGTIEFTIHAKNNHLEFRIKDSGIGIPDHQQKLIFDYFRQADGTSTRSYNGIGVGLAISNRITRILGGKLAVSSIPGKGSTFTFEVPVTLVANLEEVYYPNGKSDHGELEDLV